MHLPAGIFPALLGTSGWVSYFSPDFAAENPRVGYW